jgi:Protein of unknown function (DUF3617)
MHKTLVRITFLCCFLVLATIVWGQIRKAGLWELTTTTTWQQSPFPAGSPATLDSSPHTIQVCLTQEQIDKYGAIMPRAGRGCQITNIVKKPGGMTGDMVCSGGAMTGKGSLEATSTDDEHAKGHIHFVGAVQIGQSSKPMEWSSVSTSFYKGADCGSVKPFPMPDK